MLERFKVPHQDEVRVPESSLRETVATIFEKMGVPSESANEGADVLVMTDLRGVETHGVSNMLTHLCARLQGGSSQCQAPLAHHPRDSRHCDH